MYGWSGPRLRSAQFCTGLNSVRIRCCMGRTTAGVQMNAHSENIAHMDWPVDLEYRGPAVSSLDARLSRSEGHHPRAQNPVGTPPGQAPWTCCGRPAPHKSSNSFQFRFGRWLIANSAVRVDMRTVRLHRRKVCYEKRNAHQCFAARGKPYRNC